MKWRPLAAPFAWMALPVALYLIVLRHVWFGTPTWDDFDAMLQSAMTLMDAHSAREWLERLFMQHNEHRIAFARLVAWAMASAAGTIDFRLLALLGNLAWIAVLVLLWAEFHGKVADAAFMAAAFLMLQWSYWEASMLSMAALSNMGVVLFALACLHFSIREGKLNATLAVVLGVLAAWTLGNGLFALPLAAAGCVLLGRRARAAVFAVAAAAIWIAYFHGYSRPSQHPSLLMAAELPLDAVQLFLIVLGGILPGRWLPIPLGLALLAVLLWLVRRGLWRDSPTCTLWIAFVLVSAMAAALGRVGFGVYHAPRYSLYSSLLAAVLLLLAFERFELRRRLVVMPAVLACAAISLLVTHASWPEVHRYSFTARLLAEAVPIAPAVTSERYFGVLYPSREWSARILAEAERRRLFLPRKAQVQPMGWAVADAVPPYTTAGHLDESYVDGDRLVMKGWTHLPATLPGRVFTLSPASDAPLDAKIVVAPRPDIALTHDRPDLLFSGFELQLRYGDAEQARKAARHVCLSVRAARHEPAVLGDSPGGCAR